MSAERESLVRGWCPGALRPMETGDGLLVRLRITGGIVPAALARDLADAARRFGNGLIDLSARANLQLRGVTPPALAALTVRLRDLGLLDEDPAAESVRNVIASPLAGLAPDALLDIRPIVRALEARLVADARLHALPGKFGFLVDDGSLPRLADVGADLRFEAVAPDRLAARLAGGTEAALCAPGELPDRAAALALAWLRLRGEGSGAPRRMQALVERIGEAPLFEAAGLRTSNLVSPPPDSASVHAFGVLPLGDFTVLGLGAPFGRWQAEDLVDLADVAEQDGSGEIRLTPFRALLLPGLTPARAAALQRHIADRFIVSADDPRLAVVACPGAPGCANATTATHEDALALATVARATVGTRPAVHVSGCAKGCAHPGRAPVTLIGRDGRYDFVQNGSAADEPARRGLTIGEAKAALAALASAGQDAPSKDCP